MMRWRLVVAWMGDELSNCREEREKEAQVICRERGGVCCCVR